MARPKKKAPPPNKLIAAPDQVRHHYSVLQTKNRDVATSRGEMSDLWDKAKKDGIHKRALADTMKVKNMEETKRDDYLRAREQYENDLDVRRSPDLLDDNGAQPDNVVDFTGNTAGSEAAE